MQHDAQRNVPGVDHIPYCVSDRVLVHSPKVLGCPDIQHLESPIINGVCSLIDDETDFIVSICLFAFLNSWYAFEDGRYQCS